VNARTLIRIGHGSYSGANRSALAYSKAQAVRILRLRGIGRDKARAAIDDICKRRDGYATVRAEGFEVVEVCNVTERAAIEQWPSLNYSRAQQLRYGEMA